MLLDKHDSVAVEIAQTYISNMEIELGKKYRNRDYQINPDLSDAQYTQIQSKHQLSNNEFAELYNEFQHMQPSEHLSNMMAAFTASGGNVDIDPRYDETTQRLHVDITFSIKDKLLDSIEGLSPLEDAMMRMNAMLQVDSILSGANPDIIAG